MIDVLLLLLLPATFVLLVVLGVNKDKIEAKLCPPPRPTLIEAIDLMGEGFISATTVLKEFAGVMNKNKDVFESIELSEEAEKRFVRQTCSGHRYYVSDGR